MKKKTPSPSSTKGYQYLIENQNYFEYNFFLLFLYVIVSISIRPLQNVLIEKTEIGKFIYEIIFGQINFILFYFVGIFIWKNNSNQVRTTPLYLLHHHHYHIQTTQLKTTKKKKFYNKFYQFLREKFLLWLIPQIISSKMQEAFGFK